MSSSRATKYQELISKLPKEKRWSSSSNIYQYQGFWYPSVLLEGIMSLQDNFKALPADVFICGAPKTGNTWLKALCYAIATRNKYFNGFSTNPLLHNLPHSLVPFMEVNFSRKLNPEHTLLSTHLPYPSLPRSIMSCSGCKIIYICRGPKDTFVSLFHYTVMAKEKGAEGRKRNHLGEEFELFCEGRTAWGPYWDHVLEYWEASVINPEKILFLKYEEMKSDTLFHVKKMAEFMNKPFSVQEEKEGLPEKIVKLCSFENLSNLEVNKTGKHHLIGPFEIDNRAYFRKGKTGDWRNSLTAEMARRIDHITEEKLRGSTFRFGITSKL